MNIRKEEEEFWVNIKIIVTSIYPLLSGSSSSMIEAAYVAACFLKFASLLAEALIIRTFFHFNDIQIYFFLRIHWEHN